MYLAMRQRSSSMIAGSPVNCYIFQISHMEEFSQAALCDLKRTIRAGIVEAIYHFLQLS